jgi:hypothetical protein
LIKSYNILLKSLFLTISLFTLLFVFSGTAMAGNIDIPTANLKRGSFSVGLEANISGRDVDYSNKVINENAHTYLVKGSYGLLDRVNLFGKLGAGSINDNTGFEGHLGLAYGGGVKLHLYQYEDVFLLGLTGQYLRFTSQEDNVSGVNGLTVKSTWNEYDIALGASTLISVANFYAGGLLSFVDGERETPSATAHFKQSHPYGAFVGADAELIDHLRFGIEGRFFDETSVSFKLSYAFGGPKQGPERK